MRIFFITGEVSGDRHAAPVVAELRRRGCAVSGVGGPRMAGAGATLLSDSTGWGAMGVPEAARKLPRLLVQSRLLLRHIRRLDPDVVALVDFGYFNSRMARHLTNMGMRVLYYFPPGSWRQEPRDWSGLAAITDCIATPFARNAEHLRASGANAHWVGHPVVDAIEPAADRRALRAQLGLPDGEPLIGILPGSRVMERRLLGPPMLDAASIIRQTFPRARFLWSDMPHLGAVEDRLQLRAQAAGGVTTVGESHDILRAGDLVLTAMGTATLEAAAALTPMVAIYDGSTAAKWIAIRALRQQQPFYAMPNILLGRELVPEVVPRTVRERVSAERIASAALELLGDPARMETTREGLGEVRAMLGEPGAAIRTAELIDRLARNEL